MKFGTDGIRGAAGVAPIDGQGAARVGAAAARWAQQVGQGRVLVGRDTRPSGGELADAALQGVVQSGGRALDGGVLPTPALQAALAAGLADVGVMVTASHNPASDNGFKVLGPGGRKPNDAQTAHLEALMVAPTCGCGGPVEIAATAAREAWAGAMRRALGDLGELRGRRIVVDAAHGALGAARSALTEVLAGVDIVWLHGGDGVINDGVGSEHPGPLAEAVVAHRADAGVAVDGDADRALLVDEAGRVVPGDAVLWLLARARRASTLVVTVMSSTALEAGLPGVRVVRTGVGDRLVAAAMAETGAEVGGEESGHVLLAGGVPGGDGLLTGLAALSAAWTAAPTVSGALTGFAVYPRRLTKVRASRRVDVAQIPGLSTAEADWAARLGPGRVFVRWSGTEPVLRVLVEGPDAAVVAEASDAITAACAAALGAS